jgi:hypothetical protein
MEWLKCKSGNVASLTVTHDSGFDYNLIVSTSSTLQPQLKSARSTRKDDKAPYTREKKQLNLLLDSTRTRAALPSHRRPAAPPRREEERAGLSRRTLNGGGGGRCRRG